jgi:hypothetical protein
LKATVIATENRFGKSPLPLGKVLSIYNKDTGEEAEIKMIRVKDPDLEAFGYLPLDIVHLSNDSEVN